MHAIWVLLVLGLDPSNPNAVQSALMLFDSKTACVEAGKTFAAAHPADEVVQALCVRKTQKGEVET